MFRKYRPVKIEIDPLAVSCDTPHMSVRLDRIAANYRELDHLLSDLESRMPAPDPVLEMAQEPVSGGQAEPFRPQKPR